MKILLLTTEKWTEITEAVATARKVLGVEINVKQIDIDLKNEYLYDTHSILFWNKPHQTKSIKTNIIHALGVSKAGGKEYDCYGIIADKKKALSDEIIDGEQSSSNGKQFIEVYAYKGRANKKKRWGYSYTTYNLIHEILHAMDSRRGVAGSALHTYLEKNDTLDAYISSFNETETLDLLPAVRRKADKLIAIARLLGMDLRITSGFRSFKEQDKLYAQGRTKPGNIVTNAKGGQSMHNFGVAFDIVDRKLGYNLSSYQWKWLNVIASLLKLEWGGTWGAFSDKPHFQYLAGYTESEIIKGAYDTKDFL